LATIKWSLRLGPALTLMCALALALAVPGAWAEDQRFENEHYRAEVLMDAGGLLAAVASKATGEALLARMRIYTDFGVYEERGYVGTGGTSCAKLTAEDGTTRLVTVAEGTLQGEPAVGQKAIGYRVETRFDDSPTIHVKATIEPQMDKEEVNGFLALCWSVPAMARWRLRSVEGLLRHTLRPGEAQFGRSYNGEWPLDPVNPLIAATTAQGAELRVENLTSSGVPAFAGPVIHGETIFLLWLGGSPDLVAGKSATLEFDLKVVAPGR